MCFGLLLGLERDLLSVKCLLGRLLLMLKFNCDSMFSSLLSLCSKLLFCCCVLFEKLSETVFIEVEASVASNILSAIVNSSSVGLSPTAAKATFSACGRRRNHNFLMMLVSKVPPAVCFIERNNADGFRSPSSTLSSNCSSLLLSEAECLVISVVFKVWYLSVNGGSAMMSITVSHVSPGSAAIVKQYFMSSFLILKTSNCASA